jgi:prophage regulatory protein
MEITTTTPNRLLRLAQVEDRLGLKRSAIYKLISEGSLERPLKIGLRSSRWTELSIERFIEARVLEAKQAQTNTTQKG